MNKAFKYSRYTGTFIMVVGVLHLIIGLVENWRLVIDIFQSGIINTVNETVERYSFYWYEIAGLFVIYFGSFLQQYLNEYQKCVPKKFGYYLLIITAVGCLLEPISGFYLFIIPSILIIYEGNRNFAVD